MSAMTPRAKRPRQLEDSEDGNLHTNRKQAKIMNPGSSTSDVVPDNVLPPAHPPRNGSEQSPQTLPSVDNVSDVPQTADPTSIGNPSSNPRPRPKLPRMDFHRRAQPTPVENKVVNLRTPSSAEFNSGTGLKLLQSARAFMKADKSKYQYKDIQKDQCRLLYLKPGSADAAVNATLMVVDDDQLGSEDCPYEALSYHWGNGKESDAIFINEDFEAPPIKSMRDAVTGTLTAESMKERRLYVRPNLYEALKCLRRQDKAICLWVDALCIWQNNEEEKTIQVMKMAKIYRGAHNVCIWLGPSDPTSEPAMSFIKDVISLETLPDLLDDTKNDKHIPKWGSLFQILKWSWFSRRWVIQELALAKQATVHVGNHEINWSDFKDAIGIFHKYFKDLKPKLQNPKLSGIKKIPDVDLGLLGAKLLVDLTSSFRSNPDGSYESTYSLEMLVSVLAGFDTSDPRDTINSVRNIAKELNDPDKPSNVPKPNPPPEPDYKKNLLEIYAEFLEWVINDSENKPTSLDILCRHWALPEKERLQDTGPTAARELVKLPSWILTVDKGTGRGAQVFEGRKAGESFVGLPGRSFYHASGTRAPSVRFSKESHVLESVTSTIAVSLAASGWLIGQVAWCSDSIPDGVIPRGCLEKLGWDSNNRTISKAPDQLWRTLVADRGIYGGPVPSYYHRACLYALVNETPNGHINTKELLRAGEFGQPQSIVNEYLERVQAVTWNRVILQGTTPGNVVGLGPPGTQPNDVIAILFGCSVPVILRPSGLLQQNGGPEWYEMVGEAYIYGKMDGEAMVGDYEEKEFLLQ